MNSAVGTPSESQRSGLVSRAGFVAGQVVQEFGYDRDVDDDYRFGVEDVIGSELEDEDYTGVADAAIVWWRADDGDLVDALVDTLATLGDRGFIVLMTPRTGLPGAVDPSEVEESAVTAGLHTSGQVNACASWTGTRLVAPRTARR